MAAHLDLMTRLPSVLTGVALVALAAYILWIDPRRGAARALAVVLFARAIAAFAIAATFGANPSTALELFLTRATLALHAALPFAALYFAATFPRRRTFLGLHPRGWLVVAVPAAILAAVATAFPEFGVSSEGDIQFLTVWVSSALFTAFGALALLYARDAALAATARERRVLVVLSLGFGVEIAYTGATLVGPLFVAGLAPTVAFDTRPIYFGSFFAVGAFLLAAALLFAVAVRRRERAEAAAVGLLAAAAIATGAYVGLVAPTGGGPAAEAFPVFIRGLWRLVLPAFVAYALLRHRLFDIDLKLKEGLRLASVAGAFLLVALATGLAVGAALGTNAGVLAGGLAAGVLAVGRAPVGRLGSRIANAAMPGVQDSTDYVMLRKLEVYRHTLEDARARGTTDLLHDPFVSEMRKSFGISLDAHHAIVMGLGGRASPEAALAPAMRGKFRIERELGSGGFGKVLLAHDTVLDRKVVLKHPTGIFAQDSQMRDLFLKEARLAARIEHPNVVPVYEVLTDGELPILVMGYVEGGSLESLLKARRTLSHGEVARLAAEALAGLDRIHREGIVHRDIKPGNILLDARGVARITDFGIAHAPAATAAFVTVAGTGYQPGSLAYMSPEQARGDAVDARSDLYSLGVVLHECLTGKQYLADGPEGDFRLRTRVQTERLPLDGPLVPPDLAAVLERATRKEPAGRYANAAEMAAALATIPRAA